MPGRNREDVERYSAMWLALTRAQAALSEIDLEFMRQTNCPFGHPFVDSSQPFPVNGAGKVTGAPTNLHIEPSGRVVCRLCRNDRVAEHRKGQNGVGVS